MTKQQFIRHFIRGWKYNCKMTGFEYDKRVALRCAYSAASYFTKSHRIGNDLPF